MSDYHNHPVPENPTSGDTAPGNPEDSSANPRIAYAQLPYGTARTQQPMYAARPVGRQPVGMPMQPPPQQRQRRESRFSYKTGVPPRRNGKWMPDQQCGFGNAIKRFFDGYAEFKGRSSRREFWLTMLPIAPITVLPFFFPPFGTLIGLLWSLFIAIPFLAVSTRRLHDANRSGWWLLLGHSGNIIAVAILSFIAVGMVFIGIGAIMIIPNEMKLDFHNPNTFAGQLLILLYASFGFLGVSLIIQTCLYSLPSKPEGARFD